MTNPTESSINDVAFEYYALGAATFDLTGLPKEYFTLVDGNSSIAWVQPIFQSLGIKSLLTTSLPVESFQHAVIYGKDYVSVVIRQQSCYLALLLDPAQDIVNDDFIAWGRTFDVNSLKRNPRFHVL
ncbi:MAG: hypothetical protein WCO45_13615 [Pseudanabaena sp. ELA607]|jgi:hypothetical protein